MDFAFDDEQERLRARVRDFAAERLAPHYQSDDRAAAMRPELPGELARMGLLGLRVHREYGGSGADAVTTGLVLEELARADVNSCYLVLNAALVADILQANASPEQRADWLPALASGDLIPAICLTEPEHGSDAAAIEFRATPQDSAWLLDGEKTSIMLGMTATHGLVFARTGGPGARGVTAFLADLASAKREAFTDLGNRAAGRAHLTFDGLSAGPETIVGGEGLGFVQVMRGFDYSRALIALMATGTAQAAIDDALERARTRIAFGRPLGAFQGLSFPLVEYATQLRAGRALCYEALWRKDQGLPHTTEANMVKWWVPRMAADAVQQALLTFGQAGYSEELRQAQRLRDVIALQIADGTAQITKLVVARQLLGRDFAP
ncbi:acyl-CoA dehydrogenase family protein [Nonomuraea sp. NEAU-A123]|uniref:acyl-CoA dehydrogenase family protein n=1 Tax=Nonomuraea sp. NEAU-A123 TaxID=2839649 RepID=UPI001BE436D9|nr:acyl-CoA dehydrogenase family protein [Nonomuraea sp. NEAU-A123]MBT2233806.1 acyl-CoA dehydrogenase family protein [Nonomuraea sp. NEAU-A123]